MTEIVTIGTATLYHDDCREILPTLGGGEVVISDPPYGIGYKVNARTPRGKKLKGTTPLSTSSRGMIYGDDRPFDPTPWLAFHRAALFGANYFCDRLPPNGTWLVWDKRGNSKPDDHADAELVWLTDTSVIRIHRQKWRGVVREGEENCSHSPKLHPNQKPVALLAKIMDALDVTPSDTVVDPYMGAGSTAIAALRRGAKFIGCEISSEFFDVACKRIAAEVAA
jgi:site-specific DNA-methyltransferase (adenine-specific)